MIFADNLFEQVLINPVNNGFSRLQIVSGYATAAMVFHHLEALRKISDNVKIELIIGMAVKDGASLSNHSAIKKLMNDFKDQFRSSYLMELPPVHSKLYIWSDSNNSSISFIGSANYTQNAFFKNREILANCESQSAVNYYNSLIDQSIYCDHEEAENLIQIYNRLYYKKLRLRDEVNIDNLDTDQISDEVISGLERVNISFLDRRGNLPDRSGLNWGQRPEVGREPNQAYIRIPSSIQKTDFFPDRGKHFTIKTDDDKILICTRAQANGKAIHTPHNNSLIGEYFRNRLGVGNGRPVLKEHLVSYGRTDIDIYKIDTETYYLDFSVNNG